MRRPLTALLVLALLAVASATARPVAASAADHCDRYVADDGRDSADGTSRTAAVATLSRLVQLLGPGDTGCLVDGTTLEGHRTLTVRGTATAPVTLTVEPGGTAQVRGQTHVTPESHDVVIRGLRFTGLDVDRSTMLIVAGDRIRLEGNELTSPRTICLDVKPTASNIEIVGNRVHHCGTSVAWTSADSGAHGIYVQEAKDVAVTDNVIHDNAYRGVQTWPGALRVQVERNVFLRNGTHVNLGHDGDRVSTQVTVRNNIMSDATLYRAEEWKNVSSIHGYLPDRELGNVVADNCIHQQRRFEGLGEITGNGLDVRDNRILDEPVGLVDPTASELRLRAGSPCAGYGPASIQPRTQAAQCGTDSVRVDLTEVDVASRSSEGSHWLRLYVRDASGTWRVGDWVGRTTTGNLWRYTAAGWQPLAGGIADVSADRPSGSVWLLRYVLVDNAFSYDWVSLGSC